MSSDRQTSRYRSSTLRGEDESFWERVVVHDAVLITDTQDGVSVKIDGVTDEQLIAVASHGVDPVHPNLGDTEPSADRVEDVVCGDDVGNRNTILVDDGLTSCMRHRAAIERDRECVTGELLDLARIGHLVRIDGGVARAGLDDGLGILLNQVGGSGRRFLC